TAAYTKLNGGQLPPTVDSLFAGSPKALIEEQLGGPISSKVIYFPNRSIPLRDDGTLLLAVIAFPIQEDRRERIGRYVMYRTKDGKISSAWKDERVIQEALANANLSIPRAPLFVERPIARRSIWNQAPRFVEKAAEVHASSAAANPLESVTVTPTSDTASGTRFAGKAIALCLAGAVLLLALIFALKHRV
ncbi:MAG: hypothetical protein JWQ44_2077, partial [Chthoniobacter sp.]|nr:hypothetical protein [Chthoniobacter sp.]